MKSSLTSLFFHLLPFLLSFAADMMIAPALSITDGERLVYSSQSFELGFFFSPGNSKNSFLGMWYKDVPGTVVWVANRNSPIVDKGGVLTINSDGNLILFYGTNSIVWSSYVSRKAEGPVVAQLLDSGNFVVKDNKTMQPAEIYPWQSFYYQSDTLLPGMKLGKNLKTGSERFLTSWKSADDPSPGNFTFRLGIQGLPSLFCYLGSAKMYRTGPWDGYNFVGTRIPVAPNLVFVRSLVHNEDEIYYRYEPFNSPIIKRLTLNPEE